MANYDPVPGSLIFDNLKDEKCIVMATNVRIVPGIAKGIMRAAKDLDAPIMFELARSEMNLDKGYTGLTPADFGRLITEVAKDVQYDMWALHADHITIKKGEKEEMESTKKLIEAQIAAGFTSFAIDASHIFNFEGKTVREELAGNIAVTTEIGKFIKEKMKGKSFGLEVEVGEIGRKGKEGAILTKPEEAVEFIKALNENGVFPQVLAIANGSTHGNIYDDLGRSIPQVSINIEQTMAVAKALKDARLNVRIAQHGITGTPRELIKTKFPKGDIIKGNVGTHWQNIVWDTYKIIKPEFYEKVYKWTMDTYTPKNPGKSKEQIFGENVKNATKVFFNEIYGMDPEAVKVVEDVAYAEAKIFLKCFDCEHTAAIIRKRAGMK